MIVQKLLYFREVKCTNYRISVFTGKIKSNLTISRVIFSLLVYALDVYVLKYHPSGNPRFLQLGLDLLQGAGTAHEVGVASIAIDLTVVLERNRDMLTYVVEKYY